MTVSRFRMRAAAITAIVGALGVVTLTPAFAQGAPPALDDLDGFETSFAVADDLAPLPGGDVALSYPAATFDAGEEVEIYLFAGPTNLTASTVDLAEDDGSLDISVTIPADADVGDADLVATGSTSGNGVITPITVSADPAPDFNPIDYTQPGQFDLSPCVTEDDIDCIESVGYLDADGEVIRGGYLLDGPDDIGFTCTNDHVFQNAGNYWNFPDLNSETDGSVLLVNPSLTTPSFNHECSRSAAKRVQSNDLVAEQLFVSLYAAGESSPYGQMLIGEPRTTCPETEPHTSTECMRRAGPGDSNRFVITMRISGFSVAYAYASTANTQVEVEPLDAGGVRLTVSGTALAIPGVWDQESFDEGSLRTAEQADFLEQMWFFRMKNANDPGFPSACSSYGFPMISGNHAWGGEPEWDSSANELVFNMGAPHLAPDGEPFLGVYEARIPVDYAECLWGIDPTSLVTDLEVAVIDEDGTERAEGEFDASITIVDDMLHIDADGFHFSEPDVVVRSSASFMPVEPGRVVDTRISGTKVSDVTRFKIADATVIGDPNRTNESIGVPTNAAAVAINLTVTGTEDPGFVSVYPCASTETTPPNTSNINYTAGATVANSAVVPLNNGYLCVKADGTTDVLIDVAGYLAG